MANPVPALGGRFFKEMLQRRNSAVDKLFYNVDKEDEEAVSGRELAEGSVVYVPGSSGKPRYYADAVEFLRDRDKTENTGAIAIAGVGSSALGAVALARDVAKALKIPVAAVVAGYGLSDWISEGFGGGLTLRRANQLEFILQEMSRTMFGSALEGLWSGLQEQAASGGGPDLATLKSLLRGKPLPKLRWLVGHSKGTLIIACALWELVHEFEQARKHDEQARKHDPKSDLESVDIVLLSALVHLPPNVGRQHQIIGQWDTLGWINSRLNISHKTVAGAGHHLNNQILLPNFLNAGAELKEIAERSPQPPEWSRAAGASK